MNSRSVGLPVSDSHETGNFGHRSYSRKLTPAESAAYEADIMRNLEPWIAAAEKARVALFGEGV